MERVVEEQPCCIPNALSIQSADARKATGENTQGCENVLSVDEKSALPSSRLAAKWPLQMFPEAQRIRNKQLRVSFSENPSLPLKANEMTVCTSDHRVYFLKDHMKYQVLF